MRLLLLGILGLVVVADQAAAANFMFEANFAGRVIEGRPMFWTDTQMVLMGRDGALHTVDPRQAKDARRTGERFVAYTPSQLRTALQQEFGSRMTVTSTGHYLVVHPPGESDDWGQRFEELHRSMTNYFRVRGFKLRRPEFPLVAVIYASERDYYAASAAAGQNLGPGSLGHYDPRSNRVLMFDRVAQGDRDWAYTANTIVHEATHQTAFNVGLHSRTAESPKWAVEGLATMFEARGVYKSEASDTRHDRLNLGRLGDYRSFTHQPGERTVLKLVASDNAFKSNMQEAYANAWALTFYLSETRPREYESYLATIAARPPLSTYPPDERVRDFRQVFGNDLTILETNFFSWMDELR